MGFVFPYLAQINLIKIKMTTRRAIYSNAYEFVMLFTL